MKKGGVPLAVVLLVSSFLFAGLYCSGELVTGGRQRRRRKGGGYPIAPRCAYGYWGNGSAGRFETSPLFSRKRGGRGTVATHFVYDYLRGWSYWLVWNESAIFQGQGPAGTNSGGGLKGGGGGSFPIQVCDTQVCMRINRGAAEISSESTVF